MLTRFAGCQPGTGNHGSRGVPDQLERRQAMSKKKSGARGIFRCNLIAALIAGIGAELSGCGGGSGETPARSLNTPQGSNVLVQVGSANVTFSQVTVAGNTTATA